MRQTDRQTESERLESCPRVSSRSAKSFRPRQTRRDDVVSTEAAKGWGTIVKTSGRCRESHIRPEYEYAIETPRVNYAKRKYPRKNGLRKCFVRRTPVTSACNVVLHSRRRDTATNFASAVSAGVTVLADQPLRLARFSLYTLYTLYSERVSGSSVRLICDRWHPRWMLPFLSRIGWYFFFCPTNKSSRSNRSYRLGFSDGYINAKRVTRDSGAS